MVEFFCISTLVWVSVRSDKQWRWTFHLSHSNKAIVKPTVQRRRRFGHIQIICSNIEHPLFLSIKSSMIFRRIILLYLLKTTTEYRIRQHDKIITRLGQQTENLLFPIKTYWQFSRKRFVYYNELVYE